MDRRSYTEIKVLGIKRPGDDLEEWRGIDISAFDPVAKGIWAWSPGFDRELEAYQPNVMHLHGLWTYQSVKCYRYHRKHQGEVRYLISPHGMMDQWALRHGRWKKQAARWLYQDSCMRNSACLHALNAHEAESLRREGYRNPIVVVPNGISIVDPKEISARKRGGGHGTQKRLLYLGRIHPKKGVYELIAAWRRLHDTAKNCCWRLTIAGDGARDDMRKLQESLAFYREQGSIEYIGPVFGQEKEKLLRNADAFILPSYSEGMPVAVLEAWSYGLPVLMTRQCNMPEALSCGAAFEISVGDELANELRTFITLDDRQRDSYGEIGRSYAAREYEAMTVSAKLMRVYRWLANIDDVPEDLLFGG